MANKRFHSFIAPWLFFVFAGIAMLLAGCGRELQQRQAFIDFLQDEMAKQQTSIAVPTSTMRKRFGEYATHYDVVVDFNKAVAEHVGKPLNRLYRDSRVVLGNPEADAETRKRAILASRNMLQQLEKSLDNELSIAESRFSTFSQPNDLKAVYSRAFDKYVRLPAQEFKVIVPMMGEMLDKISAMFEFINANKNKIEIRDGLIQVKDQALTVRLNEMQADIARLESDIQARHNEFSRQAARR
ncbi:MAG: DUF3053 domain-containing protein [Azoarcus sp.]|jgi:ABC-type phosphate transport system auxiliary subunit|nr:DUF3053 domain-containing protein [Azoarcus sp.]